MRDANVRMRARPFMHEMMAFICHPHLCRLKLEPAWTLLVNIREATVGVPSWWQRRKNYLTKNAPHIVELMDVITSNPHVMEWITSPTCFVSPAYWPEFMAGSFQWGLIPTPYEYGATHFGHHVPYRTTDGAYYDYLYLRMYCYGMKISTMAAHTAVPETRVEEGMRRAVMRMHDYSIYTVWATGTNFRKAIFLPQMWHICDNSTAERGKFIRMLQKNIFAFPLQALDAWTRSPLILSYLIHHTPKQPRTGLYAFDRRLGDSRHVQKRPQKPAEQQPGGETEDELQPGS